MKVEVLSEGGGVGGNFLGRLCLGFEDFVDEEEELALLGFFVWGF